jgi:uncharacterized protein DUF1059
LRQAQNCGPEFTYSRYPVDACLQLHLQFFAVKHTDEEAHMAGTRKIIDCRKFPAEKPCSIAISGTEDEVLELAMLHASTVHGHKDTPEFRQQLRSMIQDEKAVEAEAA